MLRWSGCVAFVLAFVALMPVAHAQLQLNVPGACGNEAAFRARVDQLAGEHAVDRAEASVLVRRETRGGYRLQVTLAGAVRRSQHADCRVLVDAAALIVALSVNPALAHDPPAPEPPEPATTDSADTQEASPADEPPPARPLPMWKLAGHADVALLHGAVPAWSVPLSVGMRTSRGSFGFGLALRYIPPRESDGSLRVRVQGAGGRALALYLPRRWLELGLGLEADLLHGQGRGVPGARSDTTSRVAAKLELAFPLPLSSRHALALTASTELAMQRGAFVVGGYGSVFTPEMIAFSMGARWQLTIL